MASREISMARSLVMYFEPADVFVGTKSGQCMIGCENKTHPQVATTSNRSIVHCLPSRLDWHFRVRIIHFASKHAKSTVSCKAKRSSFFLSIKEGREKLLAAVVVPHDNSFLSFSVSCKAIFEQGCVEFAIFDFACLLNQDLSLLLVVLEA